MTKQWQVSIDLFLGQYETNKITRDFCLGQVVAMNSATISSSQANVTPKNSLGRLLASQCDTKEILGGARKRLGVGGEAREEVLPAAGDLCSVAVRLGLDTLGAV